MQTSPDTGLLFKVLYVDENRKNALTFRQAFGEMTGIAVATDRQEALNILKGHSVEVAVFDDALVGAAFLSIIQRRRRRTIC